jgi:hypothetical protein
MQADTFDGAEVGLIDASGEWVKTVPDNTFHRRLVSGYTEKIGVYQWKAKRYWLIMRRVLVCGKLRLRIMIKKVAESIALRKGVPPGVKRLVYQGGNAR